MHQFFKKFDACDLIDNLEFIDFKHKKIIKMI